MAARIYAFLLRAFPRRHRDAYGAEMLDAFQQELAARTAGGARFPLSWCVTALLNTIGAGFGERSRQRHWRFGPAFSSLDFVLAWRMLLRYPGLSIISVFGMAVGIAVAATAMTVIALLMDTRMPLPDDERIVSMVSYDTATQRPELRLAHDYPGWREMASMQEVGIQRQVERNLVLDGRVPEPVTVAEISASAFRVAGVPALRGRHLVPEDEAPDAPDVIVIGYDEWVRRFEGDPDIVGRSVQLGLVSHQIVGVMPEGFGFPVNHTFWIPWRADALRYQPRTGPQVGVSGRLAPGATLESAQAELTEIARRAAADSPSTHEHLQSRVMPYVYAYTDMGEPENFFAMTAMETALVLLLVIVCVNVAILVYARTTTRQGEIAVRSALGASRRRIIAQLFVEALAMAGVAAVIGLFVVWRTLPLLQSEFLGIVGGHMPFWLDFRLTVGSALSIVALTMLAAAIVGVLPALKATGRNVQPGLQTLGPGSGSRMQMGRMWTLLIVSQVALTVALLPAAMFFSWVGLRVRTGDGGFASQSFVRATLAMERTLLAPTIANEEAFRIRFAALQRELDQRLRADPQVVDSTFSLMNPQEELAMALEAEGQAIPEDPVDYSMEGGRRSGHLVRYNRVATNYFEALEIPFVAGRDLSPADIGTDHVVINRTLAQMVFGAANPLGGRIKYVGRSREANGDDDNAYRLANRPTYVPVDQWFEVVGIVPDFPADALEETRARVYHPIAAGDVYPVRLGVRVRSGEPAAFSGRLREIAAAVDLDLQVRDVTTDRILMERQQGILRMMGVTVALVMFSVLTLSAAGVYSLMSFTVAKRRREIGIRAALGADHRQLLLGMFSRVLGQLAVGVFLGALGAVGVEKILEGDLMQAQRPVILPLVALVMIAVGIIAAIGPARQGLRIHPTDALRED